MKIGRHAVQRKKNNWQDQGRGRRGAWEQSAASVEASKALLPKPTTEPPKGQGVLAVGLCICSHLLGDEAAPMITEQGLDQCVYQNVMRSHFIATFL